MANGKWQWLLQLGDDDWGRKYKENLAKFHVSATHVGEVSGRSTGMAQINVADNGENQIVIAPGANDLLSTTEIEEAHELLDSSKVSRNQGICPGQLIQIWLFQIIIIYNV